MVNVISLDSLVVDRVTQATDGSIVTFDEAVRLIVATADSVDWSSVAAEIKRNPAAPYLGSMDKVHELLLASDLPETATAYFESS